MLISQLIEKLQDILDREGDEYVYIEARGEETTPDKVTFHEGDSGWDYYYPRRVVIS